jgi:EmrB/QacA subfamily drug resistance transporter
MKPQERLVLVIAIMASFVGALDGFIVNVALPAISKDVGGGLITQQWVVDAYFITLGALILVAGSLSDLFGRRRVLSIGLLSFGIASLLCAAAPNSQSLIAARALQGAAGALLVPSSLALIMSSFNGAGKSRAIGIWTAWFSIAAVLGPLLSGLILAVTSWRWIFAINVFPIALTLVLMKKLESSDRIDRTARVDFIGAILCAGGLAAVVFSLIEQTHYSWSDFRILIPLLGGLVALGVFVWYEARTKAPMLPLGLFAVRNFSVGNVATFAIYGGLSMATFIIAVSLQQVMQYSALQAGLAMLPVTAIMFFGSSRFGALAGRYGPRFFMAVGPLVAAAGFLLMLRAGVELQYMTQLLPGILVFGLGLSMTVAPLTSAILGGVESARAGIASAVNNAVSRIAGLVMIAFIGVITGPHLSIAGFHRVLIVTAVLLSVGGVVSAIGIQNAAKPAKVAD